MFVNYSPKTPLKRHKISKKSAKTRNPKRGSQKGDEGPPFEKNSQKMPGFFCTHPLGVPPKVYLWKNLVICTNQGGGVQPFTNFLENFPNTQFVRGSSVPTKKKQKNALFHEKNKML